METSESIEERLACDQGDCIRAFENFREALHCVAAWHRSRWQAHMLLQGSLDMTGLYTLGDSTHLFAAASGDQAGDELIISVYEELRQVASRLVRRERTGHSLSATAVVHEAVIRLLGNRVFATGTDRSYLFASAARAMRRVLVEHARRRATDRRGGQQQRIPLDRIVDRLEAQDLNIADVHEALDRLAERNERQARVMTLRYFGLLTVAEVATALEISPVTVERDWRLARAWLRSQLREEHT